MIRLALAIAFLAVFGLGAYALIAYLTKDNSKTSKPKKNVK